MKEVVAYFIGGPLDLSKQVLRDAMPVFQHAEMTPMMKAEVFYSQARPGTPVPWTA